MAAEDTTRGRLSRRRRALGLAAGGLIVVFLALGAASGWGAVEGYDWDVKPAEAVAGCLALLLLYTTSAIGYVVILEWLGQQRLPRGRVVTVWARSLLGRYVPGNVLMVASRVVLGQEAGIPRKVSLAASVYEQALSLGAAAACVLVLLAGYGASEVGPAAWLVALVPAGLLVLDPRLFGRLSGALLRRMGREPLGALLSGRQLLALFAWYLMSTLFLALGVALLVRSVVGSDGGSLLFVGLSFLLSFVISMLAFIFPSGLGVREGAFALMLGRHLPGSVAITISAGVRLALTAVELVFIAVVLLLDRARS